MSQRLRSWAARQFPFVLPLLVLVLAWPWAILGLWKFLPYPRWAKGLTLLGGLGLLVDGLSLRTFDPWASAAGVYLVPIAICVAIVSTRRPRLDRDWVEEQSMPVRARFDGDRVTIENYRHTLYRTLEDFDVRFCEREFDLSQVRTVDFLVVTFSAWRGVAHVFVSFGFADGDYLSISVEARREKHEPYSPLAGLFRKYEVIYVVGDERDVVGKRAKFQRDPVYLYRMRAEPAAARGLLVSMLEKADALATRPEFYHTVMNTCTSNLLEHAMALGTRPRRFDFRLVFPGFADGLAAEIGLVEAPQTGLEALREAALINGRAEDAPMGDGKAWSRALRVGTTAQP